jgi:hypothetical protein
MAGLAILGTLLASLVVARGRYMHQWALAGRKQVAVQAADRMLAAWWAHLDKLPRNGSGDLLSAKIHWKTQVVESAAADDLKVQIVRLEMFEMGRNSRAPGIDTPEAKPLVQVDLVVSPPAKTNEGPGNAPDEDLQTLANQTGPQAGDNP